MIDPVVYLEHVDYLVLEIGKQKEDRMGLPSMTHHENRANHQLQEYHISEIVATK
jgi:hypothetical protein